MTAGDDTLQPGVDFDVVIVGGGHNGLTAAAYLARAKKSVLVLEKNAICGGAAITEEFHPGFRNSVASYAVGLLSPKVIQELDLTGFGLEIVERPVQNFWPIDDRRGLLVAHAADERYSAFADLNYCDAAKAREFDAVLATAADVLRHLVDRTPPRMTGRWPSPGEVATVLSSSTRFLRITSEQKRAVIDLFTKSASEVLDRWFENTHIKAAYAFDAIVGAYAAPSTPGTAYVLLHHVFGEVNGKRGLWGHAIGGMGAISKALEASARASGAAIRTGSGVESIELSEGRAASVRLSDGSTIKARAIVAAVPPKLLFTRMLQQACVPEDVSTRFRHIRSGSGTFRMNVALSELPDFLCRPGKQAAPHHGAGIIIGPTMDYLECAYLDCRREGWSREPVIEMLIPSVIDPGLAPEGQHVASLFVQHVAPHLPDGRSWSDSSEKERFADLVIETVTRFAPNFSDAVIARQVLSPLDLEERFGLIDGDIFHGQLGLDQLFSMRPVLGYGDYRLPVPGLFICGSGAHPGGGVTGVPGRNAAREILKDLRRGR